MPKMSKMIKDIGEDTLNGLINTFLNEHSDRIIEDWDLVTKKDFNELQKQFNVVSLSFEALEKRFNEYRGDTNTKLEKIKKNWKTTKIAWQN